MSQITPILLIVIVFNLSQIIALNDSCATLYASENFNGRNATISNSSQFTDLNEQYFTDSMTPWNTTGSFMVVQGCHFTACTKRYFKSCRDYSQTMSHLSGEMIPVLSAKCTCQNDCKCSDIRMKRSSCAYAFVNNGGCNECNPVYLDMEGSKPYFSHGVGNISEILIQQGCSLRTFEEEDYEGSSTFIEGKSLLQNFTATIGSYECICNNKRHSKTDSFNPSLASSDSRLITVPQKMDDIFTLINNNENHVGLKAALTSVKSRRNSHNAYILALGTTGSGKSSAINLLMDNGNITAEGRSSSTTSDILEFRVPIPLDELQIGNSELRVVDTPGLGDTRGLEYDARFLATLDEYLNTHEDLYNQIPNVVLIFHKFTDNRFSGNHSNFVKMLKGLQLFRIQITDETYSNVIFVLTHFNSADATVKKNPREMIQTFKTVIEEYSLFPKPISIIVAENVGKGNDLLSINGAFQLPNGDLYPANLIQKMIQITSKGNDPIGQSVIQNAFVQPGIILHNDYTVVSNTFELIVHRNNSNSTYSKYFNELTESLLDLESTEVSQHIGTAYESMEQTLKQRFPHSVNYLKRAMKVRNIIKLTDLPKTNLEIVELFASLNKLNEAVIYLLSVGLKLTAPRFTTEILIGQSFNALKDAVSSVKLIKPGEPIPSKVGYKLPSAVSSNPNLAIGVKDHFKVFKDEEEFFNFRKVQLGLNHELSADSFVGEIPPGYNLIKRNGTVTLTALREFRAFNLILNQVYDLSPEFSQALKNLESFNESNYRNVENWKSFFQMYGTHMVHSVYAGGSIEIETMVKISDVNVVSQSIFDLINIADISDQGRLNTSRVISHSLKFKGGDPKYHTNNLAKLSISDGFNLLSQWKKSLHLRPIILTSSLNLVPLSQIGSKLEQNVSSEIGRVTSRLVNSTLTYKPSEWLVNAINQCETNTAKVSSSMQSGNHTLIIINQTKKEQVKLKNLKINMSKDDEEFKGKLEKVNNEFEQLKSKLKEKTEMVGKRQRCLSY